MLHSKSLYSSLISFVNVEQASNLHGIFDSFYKSNQITIYLKKLTFSYKG